MIDKQQELSPDPTEVPSLIQIKQADMLKSSSTSKQTRQTMLTTLAESLVTSADRNKASLETLLEIFEEVSWRIFAP
jgi:hypothetical protein